MDRIDASLLVYGNSSSVSSTTPQIQMGLVRACLFGGDGHHPNKLSTVGVLVYSMFIPNALSQQDPIVECFE